MDQIDKANKYLELAKKFFQDGNLQEAKGLVEKSKKLHPSVKADNLLAHIKHALKQSRTSTKSPSSPTSSESSNSVNNNVPNAKKRSSDAPSKEIPSTSGCGSVRVSPEKTASRSSESTPAQRAAVQRILGLLSEIKNLKSDEASRQILGVPDTASNDDIKKSFKRLALLLHPDKSNIPGTAEAFKAVNNAHDRLVNGTLPEPEEEDMEYHEYHTTVVSQRPDWGGHEETFMMMAVMLAIGAGFATFKMVNYLLDRFKKKESRPAKRRHE